jgi:hypothetical protein
MSLSLPKCKNVIGYSTMICFPFMGRYCLTFVQVKVQQMLAMCYGTHTFLLSTVPVVGPPFFRKVFSGF